MDIKTLSELEDEFIGKKGTVRRDNYEKELADLMIGYQLRDARLNGLHARGISRTNQ